MNRRYQEAVGAIQNWIKGRELRPGTVLPSTRELSRQLGFKHSTTDIACNLLISRNILSRKGYKLFLGGNVSVPSPIQGTIHVFSYWHGFLRAAERILTERGVKFRLSLLSPVKHQNPLSTLHKALAEKPAGVILCMSEWIGNVLPVLASAKIPTVICASCVPLELNFNVAETDTARGAEKAVRHLRDLGHRHIAHILAGPSTGLNREIADSYRKTCLNLDLKSSATAIWRVESNFLDDEFICENLRKQRKAHPKVTALFSMENIAKLAMKIFRVPEEISVVGIFGENNPSHLTSVVLRDGDDCTCLWACTNLITQIQTLESGKPALPPRHTLFSPELLVRTSTRALTQNDREIKKPKGMVLPGATSPNPWESWRKTYPFLKMRHGSNWRQLDLSKLVNHSMTREHGWLGGEPLLHFSSGLRSVHGVPFQVISESGNSGRAVLTFRSPHTHSTEKNELPTRVNIPVNSHVKALYFLHGCGWAKPTPFAEYIMHFKNRTTSRIALVPIGPSLRFARRHLRGLKNNIQDWWSGAEQKDFPHAKFVIVFNPAEPQEYVRMLYTLEWINPHPQQDVRNIEVRVDPKAGPALALIAVTALL